MAEFKLGRIKFVYQGTWTIGTSYVVDDVVTVGGKTYICTQSNTASALFATDLNSGYWSIVADGSRWTGNWANSTYYLVGDQVLYGGIIYQCTTAHTSASSTATLTATAATANGTTATITFNALSSNIQPFLVGASITVSGFTAQSAFNGTYTVTACTPTTVSYALSQTLTGTVMGTVSGTGTLGLEVNQTSWTAFANNLNWTNTWSTNTRYKVRDLVSYGGYTYLCNTAHVSANTTASGLEANQSSWDVFNAGIAYQGAWSGSSVHYRLNDIVKYGASLWICTTPHTSTSTFATANFSVFVNGLEYVTGSWSGSTTYVTGDIVNYGGNLYTAIAVNTNQIPSTQSASWQIFNQGFSFVGDWSNALSYKVGQVVRQGGYTYLCTADNTVLTITATATTSGTNSVTVSSTTGLAAGVPIIFTGTSFGNITSGTQFYILSVIDSTHITLSATSGGAVLNVTSATGSLTGVTQVQPPFTGYWTRLNSGIRWNPGTATYTNIAGTNITGSGTGATFDITASKTYYTVTVHSGSAGSGYASTNTIKILGSQVGGISPANDITITVTGVSTGAISTITSTGYSVTWVSGATYVLGDTVYFGANTYICVSAHTSLTGNRPDNDATGAYWNVLASGAESAVLTTQGDMFYYGSTGPTRLPIGTDGQVLRVNGNVPAWQYYGQINNIVYVGPAGVDTVAASQGTSIDKPWATIRYACYQVENGYLNTNSTALLQLNKQFLLKEINNYVYYQYSFNVTGTSSTTLTVGGSSSVAQTTTTNMYVGMPIVFTTSSGSIVAGTVYYVQAIGSSTTFSISATFGGSVFTVGTGTANVGTYSYNQAKTERDTGIIVDGLISDIGRGGTLKTTQAVQAYFATSSSFATNVNSYDIVPFVSALNYLGTLAGNVLANTAPGTNYQTVLGVPSGSRAQQQINTTYTAETTIPARILQLLAIITGPLQLGNTNSLLPAVTPNTTIFVKTGTYNEVLPIVVPAYTAIIGDELRGTVVQPANANLNLVNDRPKSINSLTRIQSLIPNLLQNTVITGTTGNTQVLATTATTGTGTVATISFATQTSAPFVVGQYITVSGVTPSGYNGSYVVTAVTTNSVSYANTTTASQSVAGIVSSQVTGLPAGDVGSTTAVNTVNTNVQLINNMIYNGLPQTPAFSIPAVTNYNTYYLNGFSYGVTQLQNNYNFIKAEIAAYLNTYYSSVWTTFGSTNQTETLRDVGFVVDGLQYDMAYGCNNQSIINGSSYYSLNIPQILTAYSPATVGALQRLQAIVSQIVQGQSVTATSGNSVTQSTGGSAGSAAAGAFAGARVADVIYWLQNGYANSTVNNITGSISGTTLTVTAATSTVATGALLTGTVLTTTATATNSGTGLVSLASTTGLSAGMAITFTATYGSGNQSTFGGLSQTTYTINTVSAGSGVTLYNYGTSTPATLTTGTGLMTATAGVAPGTYIVNQITSIASAQAATTLASGGSSGTNTFVVSSATGIAAGQLVTGTGIPAGSYVISTYTSGTTVTLVTAAGAPSNFTTNGSGAYLFYPAGSTGTYTVNVSQTITGIALSTNATFTPITSGAFSFASSTALQTAYNALVARQSEIASDAQAWVAKYNQAYNISATLSNRDAGYISTALAYDILFGSNFNSIACGRAFNRLNTSAQALLANTNNELYATTGAITFIGFKAKEIAASGATVQASTLIDDIVTKINGQVTTTLSTATTSTNVLTVASTTGMAVNMPITFTGLPSPITTTATITATSTNLITVANSTGFAVGQQIYFTSTVFGNIVPSQLYYIASLSGSTITVSLTYGGAAVALVNGTGSMNVTVNNAGGLWNNNTYWINSIPSGTTITITNSFKSGTPYTITNTVTSMTAAVTAGATVTWPYSNNPMINGSLTYNDTLTTIQGAEILRANISFLAYEAAAYTLASYGGTVTATTSSTNVFTTSSNHNFVVGDPVVFSGTVAGGVVAGTTYYVLTVPNSTTFSVSSTQAGTGTQAALSLTTTSSDSFTVSYYYNTAKCVRDTTNFINALIYDLNYTGNYKSMRAAELYVNAITGSLTQNFYLVRNACGIRNQTMNGLTGTLSSANAYGTKRPTAGAYTSLDPGFGPNDSNSWVFSRSTFVQNCTMFGYACSGAKVDGALHAGGYKSMVANDYTCVIGDGIGWWTTGTGSLSELVSVFNYYSYAGYLSELGGRIRATNGNSSYGTYGVIAEGVDTYETPIYGTVNNRSFGPQITNVLTDSTTQILRLEYENAGQNYTNAVPVVSGSGYNIISYQDEYRDAAVFETRLIDLNNGQGVGGSAYVSAVNVGQTNTLGVGYHQIAAADTALTSAYNGMRILITAGTGVGQYANILTYTNGSKIAQIVRPTFVTLTVTGSTTTVLQVASTSTLYVNQPIYLSATTAGVFSAYTVYYVQSIPNLTTFTLSATSNGAAITGLTSTSAQTISLYAAGWDHVVPGTPINNTTDLTSAYIIEPAVSYTSPGYTATARTLSSSVNWSSVASGAGYYMAVATASTATAYSTTGKTWTAGGALPSSTTWNNVVFGGGSGAQATVTLGGFGGSGAVLTATLGSGLTAGQVVSVTVVNGGYNYTTAPTVQFVGSGTGAAATAVVLNGVIQSVTVTVNGSGYASAPTVNVVTSAVTAVTPITWGRGYQTTPTVVIAPPFSGTVWSNGGSVTSGQYYYYYYATTQATNYYLATSSGTFSSTPPSFTSGTGASGTYGVNLTYVGTQATVTPTLTNTGVSSYAINQIGYGYTSTPTITITDLAAKFVAISGTTATAYLAPSSIGSAWTAGNGLPTAGFTGLAYGNGVYVAVGIYSGTSAIASSTDGITWVNRTAPGVATQVYSSVAFGQMGPGSSATTTGMFVAVTSGSNVTAYSTNGVSWVAGGNLPSVASWSSVTYGNGRFVAVASGSNLTAYSNNGGVTWYASTANGGSNLPLSQNWSGVKYAEGLFVATATSPTPTVTTTTPVSNVITLSSTAGINIGNTFVPTAVTQSTTATASSNSTASNNNAIIIPTTTTAGTVLSPMGTTTGTWLAGMALTSTGTVTSGTWVTALNAGTVTTTGIASTVASTTGTIGASITGSGTFASPWVATISGLSSVATFVVGAQITATSGTGTLYGSTPTSVTVTSIVNSTTITYSVVGGTTPTAGTVTNISQTVLTASASSNLLPGMALTGGAVTASYVAGQISSTGTALATALFTGTTGTNTIVLSSFTVGTIASVAVGQFVAPIAGIPANTFVTAVNTTTSTITISANLYSSISGSTSTYAAGTGAGTYALTPLTTGTITGTPTTGTSYSVSITQTQAAATVTGTQNSITVGSTAGMVAGESIVFTGTSFGNIVASTTYYITEVISSTLLSVSSTYGGTNFVVTAGSGTMTATAGSVLGGLTSGTTYYVVSVSGNQITVSLSNTLTPVYSVSSGNGSWNSLTGNNFAATSWDGLNWTQQLLPTNASWSAPAFGNIQASNVGYNPLWVTLAQAVPGTIISVASSSGTTLTLGSAATLVAGQAITFGTSFGNIVAGTIYYVQASITSSTSLTISATYLGGAFTVGTASIASIGTVLSTTTAASMHTGATPLGRAKVASGAITEIRMIEPGSGFPKGNVTATTSGTNIITVDNTENLIALQPVEFNTVSAGGLSVQTTYYVIGSSITSNSFQVAASAALATIGTAVTLTTSSPTGMIYTASPIVTITDPNHVNTAATRVRTGDGVLGNPSFPNRGAGNATATASSGGDGYADIYQNTAYINIAGLYAIPQAGANVQFSNIPNAWYKLVIVTNQLGQAGNYTAQFQVSPSLTTYLAPNHGVLVTTRLKYSQVRLTGHDFLYVGSGNQTQTNYPNVTTANAIQANQTFPNIGGRVFFTATDQDGNFNVGNLFGVQQATGTATLNANAFNLAGLQSLTLGSVNLGVGSATITQFSTDPYFTANSDNILPTQKAIKSFITAQIGGGSSSLNVNTLTSGQIYVANNSISNINGTQIYVSSKMLFTGGIDGAPVALVFFASR